MLRFTVPSTQLSRANGKFLYFFLPSLFLPRKEKKLNHLDFQVISDVPFYYQGWNKLEIDFSCLIVLDFSLNK